MRPILVANRRHHAGFTVLELVVVVAIVGIVAALLFPAIQYSRESARRTTCRNNLRQIALSCLAHEGAHRHLPSGGWGWTWHGDPDRGFGMHQPGGWVFNLLPYLEQSSLRNQGQGLDETQKRSEGRKVAETTLQTFSCPTRRAPIAHPFVHPTSFVNIDRPARVARSDYAGNMGDISVDLFGPGPRSLKERDDPLHPWPAQHFSGVIYRRSEIWLAAITDGTSHTYLVCEAYLNPEHYHSGIALNDDQSMYVGFDRDTLRSTNFDSAPLRDTNGVDNEIAFGSAHDRIMHAAFCDGSVRPIAFAIDAWTHRWHGNRCDGIALASE